METSSSSIIKANTFSTINLNNSDVANAKANYNTLADAARAGYFSPITASAADLVAVEEKEDGTAIVAVVAERTTITTSANSSS